MKIGFDAKRYYNNSSGLGNYSRDLIRILAHFVPENQYLLFDKANSAKEEGGLPKGNIKFSPIPDGILARQLKMGITAQQEGCDIFHGLSGELPLKWESNPIKKVLTIHDLIFEIHPEYYSFLDRKLYYWKFKKAAECSDVIVAISEQTKQDIVNYLNISPDKIKVIYQGCSDSYKKKYSEKAKALLREKYHLPQKFVLNVGTLEERKNGFNLVKAIQNTEISLVFIGRETEYARKIKAFIKVNKLDNQVFFLQNVSNEELPIIYQLSTIFAYPSHYEGFGIPIIEALFSGIPVITNQEGVFKEAGGSDSVYVDVENPAEINKAIMQLWNNPVLSNEIAVKGKLFAQRFKDEVIAEQWRGVYRSLLPFDTK